MYTSRNMSINQEDSVRYPLEFLNSLNPGCLPNHIITLKVGVPFILIRTISKPMLLNGTRCITKKLHTNVIEAIISTGPYKDHTVHIPRIPLVPTEATNPIIFKRIQFPIKVCFALTITRAQSQTFKHMGIDFTNHPFSHGHLYTALTRVTSPRHLHLYFPTENMKIPNPVYKEVL